MPEIRAYASKFSVNVRIRGAIAIWNGRGRLKIKYDFQHSASAAAINASKFVTDAYLRNCDLTRFEKSNFSFTGYKTLSAAASQPHPNTWSIFMVISAFVRVFLLVRAAL